MDRAHARADGAPTAATQLLDQAQSAAEAGESRLARDLLLKVVLDYPGTRAAEVAQKTLVTVRGNGNEVRVVDVDIGFASMVWLFVKAAFAVIPAAIIAGVITAAVLSALGGIA